MSLKAGLSYISLVCYAKSAIVAFLYRLQTAPIASQTAGQHRVQPQGVACREKAVALATLGFAALQSNSPAGKIQLWCRQLYTYAVLTRNNTQICLKGLASAHAHAELYCCLRAGRDQPCASALPVSAAFDSVDMIQLNNQWHELKVKKSELNWLCYLQNTSKHWRARLQHTRPANYFNNTSTAHATVQLDLGLQSSANQPLHHIALNTGTEMMLAKLALLSLFLLR